VVLLAAAVALLPAQSASPAVQNPSATIPTGAKEVRQPSNRERRRAGKLFLQATQLFEAEHFEEAMRAYAQAAKLDPANRDYPLALEVARNHAVTALIQASSKERNHGDEAAARALLARAHELSPQSPQVAQHLNELGNDALAGLYQPLYEQQANSIGAAPELVHTAGVHSFHLYTGVRNIIQQVYKAWGVETTFDDSVRSANLRLDMDDASFGEAERTLGLVTGTFSVVLDSHRVLVARDNHENRLRFERQDMETVYFSGLSKEELGDLGKLAKDIFNVQQSNVDTEQNAITLRGASGDLIAFNATVRGLMGGHNQVMLEVHMIQLAHNNTRNTGTQLPQSFTAYNLYTEEQSILNANQAAVQEIISSGLASADNPLAILGILVASGQVSSSLFANGIATFGGGITASALAPGTDQLNFSLNSSDTRALDQVQLRLGDGEEGKVRLGERYPIQTASFSSGLASAASKIAGLTGAGTSSSLSSLLSTLSGSATTPMIEYQDIGLTLRATPKIMRSGDVALSLDMKIDALNGTSVNDVPILDSRTYSGVVTLKEGEGVVVAQELDKSQSRALSGTPGISEIPGLNSLSGNDNQKNYATLVIVMTTHVLRTTQAPGPMPMMRVEATHEGR
jgi:Flp pilus assembly secretin CpaC